MRTKQDLDLESQEQELEAEAAKLSPEMAQVCMPPIYQLQENTSFQLRCMQFQEQVTSLNDKARQMLELISEYRENWDERSRPVS